MISNRIRNLYREARKAGSCRVGFAAVDALTDAKTLTKWEVLAELGYVRLINPPDDSPDLSFLDTWGDDRGSVAAAKRVRELANAEGCYGMAGQYRLDPEGSELEDDGRWIEADSVWGFIGFDDAENNPYRVQIMAETIRQFRDAWKDHVRHVCPTCHGSGRID